eukprot:Rhum_TRINITY_DN14746_c9_g2::Rhum_TRINITY_DN14746_c9_g2_i1::g.115215::m.115215
MASSELWMDAARRRLHVQLAASATSADELYATRAHLAAAAAAPPSPSPPRAAPTSLAAAATAAACRRAEGVYTQQSFDACSAAELLVRNGTLFSRESPAHRWVLEASGLSGDTAAVAGGGGGEQMRYVAVREGCGGGQSSVEMLEFGALVGSDGTVSALRDVCSGVLWVRRRGGSGGAERT